MISHDYIVKHFGKVEVAGLNASKGTERPAESVLLLHFSSFSFFGMLLPGK